jgi:hypothetical protein
LPRGRLKKNNNEEELLSEQEVWSVIEFAKNITSVYGNIYNPMLVNQRMQDINMNPLAATQDGIDKSLLKPKDNEENLVGFSEFFELTDMMYKRMINYLGNMLSFDLQWVCINAKGKDYLSPAYKKDEQKMYDFLDKFNVKKEFKKVVRQITRQESFYSVLREDGEKYLLQELPRSFCKIDGHWDYGTLFSFNLYWFMQPGVSLEMYPESMQQIYSNWLENKNSIYNPANLLNKRDGSFVYWHQVSPLDGYWVWKFNPDVVTDVPFLSPLFSDIVLRPLIRRLQTNIYMLQSQKVMVGLIPLLGKEVKGGSIKDNLAVSPEVLGKFLGLLKQGLSEAIKISGAPFDDIKTFDFDGTDKQILQEYTKTTSALSGINSRLIFSLDKQSNIESQLSINVDEYLMTYMYPYFEDFLNYQINKRMKKYYFKFSFVGTEFDINKKKRYDEAMGLLDKGFFLPHLVSSAIGILPHDLERMLDEAKTKKWDEKLIPIVSAYQQSGKDISNKGGRPKAEENNEPMNDNTEASKDNSSNLGRGGKLI